MRELLIYTPSEINFRARSKLSIKNPRVIKRLQQHYIFVRSRQRELASSFRCRKPAKFQRGKIVSPELLPFLPRIPTLPEGWMQGAFPYSFLFYFRLKNNEREPMLRSVGKGSGLKYIWRERSRDATILCVSRRKYNLILCRWKSKEFAYGATTYRGFFPGINTPRYRTHP